MSDWLADERARLRAEWAQAAADLNAMRLQVARGADPRWGLDEAMWREQLRIERVERSLAQLDWTDAADARRAARQRLAQLQARRFGPQVFPRD